MPARPGVLLFLSILVLAPLGVPAEARTSVVKGTEIERVLNRIAGVQVETLAVSSFR
ncbi:MAG TPA: hypothetical protein VM557_13065 [Thermoanaerobaculia bacterium]|nr:hypothetical protein [Thermoanaerobaculia bacterium]